MKKTTKHLKMSRETVRRLAETSLIAAAGGTVLNTNATCYCSAVMCTVLDTGGGGTIVQGGPTHYLPCR
jgi:hypothetical protein